MLIEKYKELYEERAGIIEHDGGVERKKAEEQAATQVKWIYIEDEQLDLKDPKTYQKLRKFEQELIK